MTTPEESLSLAESLLRERRLPIADDIAGQLYGLYKQAVVGDCTAQCPPSTNKILYDKWHNWTQYRGLSRSEATTQYLKIIDAQFPELKREIYRNVAPAAAASSLPAGVIKTGPMYKKSDHLKSWNLRYFTLKDMFLHYATEPDTESYRGSFQLTGCEVSPAAAVKIKDDLYHQFIVTHPKDTTSYHLCCKDERDRDDWMQKIQDVSRLAIDESASHGGEDGDVAHSTNNSEMKRPSAVSDGSYKLAEDSEVFPVDFEKTYHNIPQCFHKYVDDAALALLKMSSTTTGWDVLFTDKGLTGYQKKSKLITVRGDVKIETDLLSVFEVIMNKDLVNTVNTQVQEARVCKQLSANTFVQYMKFARVRPTAQRDMLVVNHWRLLKSGQLMLVSFSLGAIDPEEEARLMPKDENGIVRAELVIGGYVLTPQADGTLCQYIVQSDLKGNIPSFVTNLVASQQPRNVGNIKRHLEKKMKDENKPTPKSFPKQYMFQDVLKVAQQGDHNPIYETMKGRPMNAAAPIPAASFEEKESSASSPNNKSTSEEAQAAGPIDKILSFMSPAVRRLYQAILDTSARDKITVFTMLTLLLPSALYYAFRESSFRGLLFLIGFGISVRYFVRVHYGNPYVRTSITGLSFPGAETISQLPDSRISLKFPLSLTPLVKYVAAKKQETGLEISFSHIILKAAAMTLVDFPKMQGNIHFGSFYLNRSANVDISVSVEVSERETVMIKIVDADMKPVEYIANEVQTRTKELRTVVNERSKSKVLESKTEPSGIGMLKNVLLNPLLVSKIQELKVYLASDLGLTLPMFGVRGHPQGQLAVMTAPADSGTNQENDVTVTTTTPSAAPIVITFGGGVKTYNTDFYNKSANYETAFMVSIVIDTRAASLSECRKFCSRFQSFLNNPLTLEPPSQVNDMKNAMNSKPSSGH